MIGNSAHVVRPTVKPAPEAWFNVDASYGGSKVAPARKNGSGGKTVLSADIMELARSIAVRPYCDGQI